MSKVLVLGLLFILASYCIEDIKAQLLNLNGTCPEFICDFIPCPRNRDCGPNEVETTSYCKCCKYCVRKIPPGGWCLESLNFQLYGVCAPGTKCINFTCAAAPPATP